MTIIFAKILGLYFMAIGLAFIIQPERFRNIYQQVTKDENFLFLGALLALLIGAVIISVHNIWSLEWPLIITILGWWSLIKGYALLIYPKCITLFSFIQNKSNVFYRIMSLCYLVLGLFLLHQAWG